MSTGKGFSDVRKCCATCAYWDREEEGVHHSCKLAAKGQAHIKDLGRWNEQEMAGHIMTKATFRCSSHEWHPEIVQQIQIAGPVKP